MNVKHLVLVSLLFGSTTFPMSAEKNKKPTQATQANQNWWQRRSPEFKAFVITVGTITGVCLMRYGWVKGMEWLEAKRAARRARNTRWQHYEYNPDERTFSFGNSNTGYSDADDERGELEHIFLAGLQRAIASNSQGGGSTYSNTGLQTSNQEIPSGVWDTYTHSFSGTSGWDTRNAVAHVPSTLTSEVISEIRKKIDEGSECPICMEGKEKPFQDDELDYCKSCKNFICAPCKTATKNSADKRCPLCRCSYYQF